MNSASQVAVQYTSWWDYNGSYKHDQIRQVPNKNFNSGFFLNKKIFENIKILKKKFPLIFFFPLIEFPLKKIQILSKKNLAAS